MSDQAEHAHHEFWWTDEPDTGGKVLICKSCGTLGYAVRPVMVDGDVKWVIIQPDEAAL
jgi:hypothetical protein